ncbi:MAG: hypothetical protein QXY79_03310 [Candidatus Methanomethylicia archaeon]
MKSDLFKKKRFKKIKIPAVSNTEIISKEQFNGYIPKDISRIDFMIEILKNFSMEEAKKRNNSFRYFMKKFIDDDNN